MKIAKVLILFVSMCAFGDAVHVLKEIEGPNGRIDTGTVAFAGQFPHVASVHHNGTFLCGGVIISVNWILTTASCIGGITSTIDKAIVRVGGIQHSGSEPGRDEIFVNQLHPHEEYDPSISPANNIALLHLERNIVFNDRMQPVTVANPSIPIVITASGTVVGWGGKIPSSVVPILQYNFNFKLMDYKACKPLIGFDVPGSICSDGTPSNPITCIADLGAPLLQYDAALGNVLHGILSVSTCGTAPTVYEGIEKHRGWIYTVSGV